MSPASRVKVSVELTDAEAIELAQLIKRLRFDQVAALTECGQSRQQREDQAYRMLHGLNQVAGALREVGYAPR
jgi:hypothetical protein